MALRHQLAAVLFSLSAFVIPAYAQNTSLQFLAVDGGRIEYVVAGDPSATETVVFIHGVGLADSFALVTKEPPLQDYRLIRMHRRGYAGSSHANVPFTMADQAADVIALLDALGLKSAHLVGHSYGGAVALQAAATAPKRFNSLVLVESALPPGLLPSTPPIVVVGAEAGRILQTGDAAGAVEVFFTEVLGSEWKDFFNAVPGGLEQTISDAETAFMVEAPAMNDWRSGTLDLSILPDRTLLIWGAESRMTLPPVQAAWKKAFPDAEVNQIAGTDHALITQAPLAIAEAVASFLAH